MRAWHYSYLLGGAGQNLRISKDVFIGNPSNVTIGNNCYIGDGVQLYAWNEKIEIGNNVLLASGVRIITRKHGFADLKLPMSNQGYDNAPIVIEDDVWIGFQAVLLPGVHIGRGCIVGSSAVVTRSIEPFSIVGGVPARLIRKRTELIGDEVLSS